MTTHEPPHGGHGTAFSVRRGPAWLGTVAIVLVCGVTGYVLGVPSTRPVRRSAEALGDLATPATTAIGRREATERLRAELVRFLEVQEWFFRENGRIRQPADVAREEGGYVVQYQADPSGGWWMASMRRAEDSPDEAFCAVAVGRVPAYIAGIHLRRSGKVRCSTDLANRLNRLWSVFVPIRSGK